MQKLYWIALLFCCSAAQLTCRPKRAPATKKGLVFAPGNQSPLLKYFLELVQKTLRLSLSKPYIHTQIMGSLPLSKSFFALPLSHRHRGDRCQPAIFTYFAQKQQANPTVTVIADAGYLYIRRNLHKSNIMLLLTAALYRHPMQRRS